ncbi:MAG: o-succinylbenzoate synthase [Chloroflexota bacterium]|nr:o-succinylbenzoate synthase [Chloroflexota bacterium]
MRSITIQSIHLHAIALPYVEPLRTSFGEEPFKACILIELVTAEGVTGWGEASVEINPGYGSETMTTALHVLSEFVIPLLTGKTINDATDVPALIRGVRGNHHAKAGVEAAIWDAMARANELRLADYFAAHLPEGHASRGRAVVGVSIGIQPSIEATLAIIRKRTGQGYQRIKLKIAPGWDVEVARAVRAEFPDVMLMLDANSAYRLSDADHLTQLDAFNLIMVEQPLADDDIYEHSHLQPRLKTPICLDESIKNTADLRLALHVGAIRVLNLKPSRVGGFTESLSMYRVCVENKLPLWIGGLMETGVGRAMNVAFASLPGVTLPCDISATDRYFDPDIAEPPFVLQPDSTLLVPDGVGSGVEVVRERIAAAAARWRENYPYQA